MSDRAWIATRKGLFELVRRAGKWDFAATAFLGEPVTMMLPDPRDGSLYAALNLGHFGVKLHRRDAGSEQWAEIAAPSYPIKPADSADPVDWTLRFIWSLACGGADEPGVLWAGTLPGGLFRSPDRGASWTLVQSLWEAPERSEWFGGGYDVPGLHSICVDPRDSRHILVGISCGGAWVTHDGGASWSPSAKGMRATYMPPERADDQRIQDPHRIARAAGAPEKLWCQHHNGIWRSTNAGADWQEITEVPLSNFGFAVAVHPNDGDTAWFVPAVADQTRIPVDAALAVTRTVDGGKSFSVLRTGLPQQHCYDLIYRHGLAVADDGRTLLMASTTGGVWLSENGGDSWRTISSSMPPAYAVCFG
ncbi:WD40/YVTN/BNR-like repeat-containing protein [Collimonas humicola]|uniref:WD40/YVTN/BNR-like repeat-containing protein n=1 Tax=Collimonas humicola TaxID=2825886 RepID=UPI001B8CEC53|nr:exo-alpha-sialidase [Collimonas humicola]